MARHVPRLVIVGLVLFAIVFFQVPRAHAGSLPCTASPSEGPVGTTFTLTASGFSPNTTLFLYAVDPSGSGFSSQQTQGFGGTVRTDATGTATFTFTSRFQQYLQSTVVLPPTAGPIIDRELGPWTLVAQELGPGNATVNQANCRVMITGGGGQALGGAQLKVSPETGFSDTNFTLTGSGFGPGQVVNTWLSPPLGCDTFGFELDQVFYYGSAASAFGYRSAKTDAAGNFSTNIFAFTPQFCSGTWIVSAYAPGSGQGAQASFLVTGHPNPPMGGTSISVSPPTGQARGGRFTVTGFGYQPNEYVACHFTRPEGNVREFPVQRANSAGQFSFSFSSDSDVLDIFTGDVLESYSLGSLGQYYMTCKGQTTGSIAITTFMVVGGPADP